MKRNEFIKDAGRWTILAFIAGITAIIIGKRPVSLGASCAENDMCRSCNKYNSCDLPQAREQR